MQTLKSFAYIKAFSITFNHQFKFILLAVCSARQARCLAAFLSFFFFFTSLKLKVSARKFLNSPTFASGHQGWTIIIAQYSYEFSSHESTSKTGLSCFKYSRVVVVVGVGIGGSFLLNESSNRFLHTGETKKNILFVLNIKVGTFKF